MIGSDKTFRALTVQYPQYIVTYCWTLTALLYYADYDEWMISDYIEEGYPPGL